MVEDLDAPSVRIRPEIEVLRTATLRKATLLATGWILAGAVGAAAQNGRLATLIPALFGPDGLIVDSEAPLPDGSDHSAHFNSAFQSQFTQFNIALGTQLSALPLPSPAAWGCRE